MIFCVVYLSAKLGQVTGKGLFQVIGDHYPRWVLYPALIGVITGNTIEAAADFGGMAAAITLFLPVPISSIVVALDRHHFFGQRLSPGHVHSLTGNIPADTRFSVKPIQPWRSHTMSQANVTTDHEAIKRWAKKRRGKPATVAATAKGEEAGVLRLDFEPKDSALETIGWDEFFEKFDEANLAFLHQDKTADGKISRFHKFVDRNSQSKD